MPEPARRKTTLTRKLLAVYLPLVCLTVLVIFTLLELRSYRLQVAQVKRGLGGLVALQSGPFTSAVWQYDDTRLEALLKDLELTPHFRGAAVHDSLGELLASSGDLDVADPELLAETTLVYETEHMREEVGRLTIAFDLDRVLENLRDRVQIDLLVLLGLIVSLVAITGLATRRMVVQPINLLRERVLRIASGDRSETVEDIRTGDQIEELAGAFATMQRTVSARERDLENARETTLTELLESAPDAMLVASPEGRICRWNSKATELFGYEADELAGMNVTQLMPASFRERHGTHMTGYFADPLARDMGSGLELLGARKDGSVFPIEIGLSPFHDPEGDMAVAAIRNITERKKAEELIKRSEQRFRTLVANLPETIYRCLHDSDWTMKFISEDVTDLTGYAPVDFIDNAVRTFDSVIHPEDRQRVADEVESAVGAKEPWLIQYRVTRADGSVRWVEERGRAVFDQTEDTEFLDGVIADITKRKEMEAAIEVARKQAEAANRAKSEFLSHMSHELRTPLNGVLGYAQILKRDPGATASQRDSLTAIVNCGSHLLALINDVLDLSKIEAGHIEIDAAPCDLHEIIKAVGDVVMQRAQGKGLRFDTEVSPEVPRGIVTDGPKLRQILVNLLGNAVKFTTTGGVTLRVSESPKDRLRFEVIDTGVGMSEEDLSHIFDPFKQVEAGKAAGGTGLGLAITQRLTGAMGGGIEVRSEENAGTTFIVNLPLVESRTDDFSTLGEQALSYDDATLAAGQSCTVLVADDRETNRDILFQMLSQAGITPLIADDGDTALEMLREHDEVELVLMDIRMPRLNGIEAVAQIRADATLKDLKVIAVTASVFPEFRDRAIEAGFDDFLGKPFRTEELMQKLMKHLDAEFVETSVSGHEAATDDVEVAVPSEVATRLAGRIREALKLGNITALNALASQLESETTTASVGRRIGELTQAFDFAGLERLADELAE